MGRCDTLSKEEMMAANGSGFSIGKILSGTSRLISAWVRSLYQPVQFEIKRGYTHRTTVVPHDDRGYEDSFQKEVYQRAASLMHEHQWQTVLDIGCGSGYKLEHYLGHFSATGVDFSPAIDQARVDHPQLTWINAEDFIAANHQADMIICADVLEHVEDPDAFMKSLMSVRNWKCILISTPERNKRRGLYHYGPPPNPAHYREWSMQELKRFVAHYCSVHSIEMINRQQATQLVTCMKE